jgi:hypothetical protein
MILYWDKSIITDKTVDFNKPEIVLNNRQNKTALVIDTAVPLTNNLPRTETEKIMKYENLVLEIKNVWKLNNVSILSSHLSRRSRHKTFYSI